jgi:methionyl aminopeptidase
LSSTTPVSTSTTTAEATAFDGKYTTFQSYSNALSPSPPPTVKRRSPVRPFPLTPKKDITGWTGIVPPPYAETGIPPNHDDSILIFAEDEYLANMRHAAKLARRVLDLACSVAKPGITTDQVDTAVHEALLEAGAYPSPLNYVGFPKSLCSSINEVICHGIPDTRPLEFGDIVSFDVSCFINGVHGDNCATIIVGDEQETDEIGTDWRSVPYLGNKFFDRRPKEDEERIRSARRLVHATRESLYEAINRIGPGSCLTDVGAAVEDVADSYGYSTVEKYRGHGIGADFHRPPFVKHYRNYDKLELVPGMVFTIEPMLVEGAGDCFEWSDKWTVATSDGGMAAQFEHTVLIREDGVEILTVPS